MNWIQKVIFILIILTSNLFAQEDLYSYKFNNDTTIVGNVSAEGHIFPNCETTFISFYNTFKSESLPPSILFFDENFNKMDSITFNSPQSSLFGNPLIFDFDGDSFDEVVFAIEDDNSIWYLYFDPSNKTLIKSKIFEVPLKKKGNNCLTSMIAVQLDKDKFYELIVNITERQSSKFPISGIWAVDIEKKTSLWENLTAENFENSTAINIMSDSLSILVHSSRSSSEKNRFGFSDGFFFVIDENGAKTVYKKNHQIIKDTIIDTLSESYSIDSVASIIATDTKNNLLWKRKIGGISTTTKLDTVHINNKAKILLSVFSSRGSVTKVSSLEIIDPLTGIVEKRKIFSKRFRKVFYHNKIIYASFFTNDMIKLDYNMNVLNSIKSNFAFSPFAKIKQEDGNLLLAQVGSGLVQRIEALDDELHIVANVSVFGHTNYLSRSKLISVYDTGARISKLYSIQFIPWYNKISMTTLRNLVISILLILLVTMLLWINTLRFSWKKIKLQKEILEKTNRELQTTTTKLIKAEKLAVYGTIASSIAHEINSPLGAIINSAQRIKKNNNTDFAKNINLIEKAGKRSKAIIEKLLLGTHRNNEDDNAYLIDVITEWKEISNKQFENLGIELQTELSCNCLVAISSTELNQIFTNLVFNARDSIVEKNGEDKRIIVKSAKRNNTCSIIIQDTGTGFSPSKLENPFEAFDTSKEKGKGTGLGLWIINNIIKNVNGELKINNYELGAEVEIIIPLYIEKNNENT